jgi:4-amino-4-deoxy-L-arabinose transferase-like glycosyltransferase
MNKMPAFNAGTLFALLLVLSGAAFARIGYLTLGTDQGRLAPALLVQGKSHDDKVTANVVEHYWFGGLAPLADAEERTSHVSPGLPFATLAVAHFFDPAEPMLRWLQCGLGILTVGCFFFFARRAFHNTLIATLAGLLIAFHPFWIVNTAELNDGVLASFLLGLSLMFGARAGQEGGAFTSLLFGLALAGLALVRAAFLPFAIVALLWFLWECRRFTLGWFAGIVALLGFANGLAPWSLRNYEVFERPVPIADTAYWHLWMGNNPHATGSTLDQATLLELLPAERKQELFGEPNQAKRYNMLAHTVWSEIKEHPTETLQRRIKSAIALIFGGGWLKDGRLADIREPGDGIAKAPDWLTDNAELILHASLLGMLILALLGWRWSYRWRREGRLAALAALWLPLPYVLSHAEPLSGPRLPLDGVLLCFAAYALADLVPGLVRSPESAR